MGKTYNVSFDSTQFQGGSNNNKRVYVTNWDSILPDKAFKVSFSYMSATAVVPSPNTVVMSLFVDLGQTCSWSALGTTAAPGGFQATTFLGSIPITSIAADEYYSCTTLQNPPVYLRGRPYNSLTTVHLHQGLLQTNFNTPVPSDYVLTLCFEELECSGGC
jgi:hypothetical protein